MMKELINLIEIVRKLRDPDNGCPWDIKQTHKTLTKFMIEEAFEFVSAVESDNSNEMQEELGDVLLQVLLHSIIAEEKNIFNLESVSKVLADKLIRRHPHVFGDTKVGSIEDVKKNWEEIKKQEKGDKQRLIDSNLLNFPALSSANKIGKKTNKIGFDWEDHNQVVYKVEEEWQELKEELVSFEQRNHDRISEEVGDFLFSTAQLARHLGICPEECLRKANKKFINRFHKMENLIEQDGKDINEMNQMEMDEYWGQVKREK